MQLGTRDLADPHEARRVRITNVLALVIGAACVPYVPIFALLGAQMLAYAVLIVITGYGLVLYLNHRGWRRLAPLLYTLTATGAVTTYSAYLGEASGIHYLFYSILVVPGLVIGSDDTPNLVVAIALPLAGFALLIAADWSLVPPVVTPAAQAIIRATMVPTTAIILLAGVLYFARTTERSQRGLDQRNRDMQRILDNVDQGLLSLARDGSIDAEYSAVVETWFGSVPPGTKLAELLKRIDTRAAEWLELGWEALVDDILPIEVTIDQLPKRISGGDRHYSLAYQVVGEPDVWDRIMVIVTDVTDALERDAGEAQQREIVAVFQRAMHDRDGVRTTIRELALMVDDLESGALDVPTERRLLHTVKGNAALFGLASVSELCHELEGALLQPDQRLSAHDREQLAARWRNTASQIAPLLGEASSDRVFVDVADATRLANAIERGGDTRDVARTLRSWLREPVRASFARIEDHARAVAERLGKSGLTVTIDDGDVRLDHQDWAPFWSALTHVVRNAIDHGIEPPSERKERGKTVGGELRLCASEHGGRLDIVVSDDGRGIDWDLVANKARARDLPHSSRAHLVEALFVDGFSTRDDVTTVSGRGIGMSAVRSAAARLGGQVHVESEPGAGTRIAFTFAECTQPRPSPAPPCDLGAPGV